MEALKIDLTDRKALVTGASRGIGRAIARLFATHGAQVAVHFHQDRAAAEETFTAMAGTGHTLQQADLSQPASCANLVAATVHDLGGLDILVNNAGIYELHAPAEVTAENWLDVWQRTIDLNLLGSVHTTFHAARHMMAQGGGRIVSISSRGAFRGEPTAPAYGAAKAGLNAYSQSLAQALAPHRIYVTIIAPGFVETDMTTALLKGSAGDEIRAQSPLGRVAQPEEVARVALFLASGQADYLSGTIVDVNGASHLRS
jgi:NAD(P)-dependent dehydrogenase (short-subunit alcohol dehydrogenase family)